jgi:glycosyltransferase involved in cell wall biosynthesis
MKIVILAGYAPFLVNFRGDLIKDMIRLGHDVVAVAPESDYEADLANIGARYVQVSFNRTGANPIRDISLMLAFMKVLKQEKADLVFSYNIKPVIYGAVAAKLSGIKRNYSLVCGLGSVFISSGPKALAIKFISAMLYKTALACSSKVFFQNPNDLDEFVNCRIVHRDKCVLVNGSGVNLQRFKPVALPGKPVFLMISRLIKDKGVVEYLDAARLVKSRYPDARFLLVGPYDKNPSALQPEELQPYIDDKSMEYLGAASDVRSFIEQSAVYVLPSYREGTPRTVLEAMAMGRPVITTDAPGCRGTVIDGVTGFLVPVRDADSLSKRMIWFIHNQDKMEEMGKSSLQYCRDKFDVVKVNKTMLDVMGMG